MAPEAHPLKRDLDVWESIGMSNPQHPKTHSP